MTNAQAPSYREIWRLAWPAILANAALPMLGFVDTALLCRVGDTSDLGAAGLGSFIFNAVYWALSFLRMSTTGFVAQAWGARDEATETTTVQRALLLGAACGVALPIIVYPCAGLIVSSLNPDSQVANATVAYVQARIWGAPATLLVYAVTGALVGRGRLRELLALQLVMTLTNLFANLFFLLGIGGAFAGARGLGAGTACGDWLAAGVGLWMVKSTWHTNSGGALQWSGILDRDALKRTFVVNAELFLRTLALLSGFFWFNRQAAQFGGDVLAANHVLLQFTAMSAFFLDGVAFVAESFVGRAVGARDVLLYDTTLKRTTHMALVFGSALSASIWLFGGSVIRLMGPAPIVAELAYQQLPFVATYVLAGVPAWQLDGVFIGAAVASALRRAAWASLVVFIVSGELLTHAYGSRALWWSMLVFIVARGLTLTFSLSKVRALFHAPS